MKNFRRGYRPADPSKARNLFVDASSSITSSDLKERRCVGRGSYSEEAVPQRAETQVDNGIRDDLRLEIRGQRCEHRQIDTCDWLAGCRQRSNQLDCTQLLRPVAILATYCTDELENLHLMCACMYIGAVTSRIKWWLIWDGWHLPRQRRVSACVPASISKRAGGS